MPYNIRTAAVLGAGTMGAQIAAHLANNGIQCLLLDMVPQDAADNPADRNRLAMNALKNLPRMKPAPLYTAESLALITPGNFEDDLPKLKEVDWVIEAIVENLDIKRDLWAKVAPMLRDDAIASTNTSGIPIKDIAADMPESFRRRFLGTHFFNPPRYLHLLEIIPLEDTAADVVTRMGAFAERVLGKGVVVAKDTPNFIANRVGTFGLLETLRAMEEHGLRADEVDAITGPLMGRPRSATFRTLDVVGIDVFAFVADNLHKTALEQWERDAFALPPIIKELVDRGWLGEKTRKGFYERTKVDGKTEILVLDTETMEFVPRRRLNAPSLTTLRGIEDVRQRMKQLVAAGDAAGKFAWTVLKRTLLYTARVAGEMADDIVSIDRALRWGFGWELGPFEVWDAIGLKRSVERMRAEGETIPEWVAALAESEEPTFYPIVDGETRYAALTGGFEPLTERPRTMDVGRLQRENKVIKYSAGATLYDMGDDVALVDFHSPKQAIGADFLQMLQHAIGVVRKDFRGLVVSSHVQPNFSVGANLALILMAAQDQEWEDIDMMVRQFQGVSMQLKYFERPVVMAPYGMTLGGGVEMSFGADRIVAAAETYMGLVEVGAGLIPGGGGNKEMVIRSIEGTGVLDGGGAGSGMGGAPVDLQPFINKAFETVAMAKVATSAQEAKALDYMRPGDVIVPNLHHLWHEAKQVVLQLDAAGYQPPAPPQIPVMGADGRAVLEMGAQQLHWAGYATEHDLHIARKLAYVLTGGDVAAGTKVSEQYLLDIEREQFLSLCGHPKSLARVQHILRTGKPLRN